MQLNKRLGVKALSAALAAVMLLSNTAFADYLGRGSVTADALRLRGEASTSAAILTMIPNGAEVDVTAREGDWYQVSYGGLTGYVHQDYLDLTPAEDTGEAAESAADAGELAEDAEEAAELALALVSVQPEEENALSSRQQEIVDYACDLIGCRYVYGGTTPGGGFDCSGFTMYVYGQFGYYLPHASSSQKDYGVPVGRDELEMGDLILFSNGGPISHVGIYIGDGKFVHASSSRTGYVVVSALSESYWVARYYGARRLVTEE